MNVCCYIDLVLVLLLLRMIKKYRNKVDLSWRISSYSRIFVTRNLLLVHCICKHICVYYLHLVRKVNYLWCPSFETYKTIIFIWWISLFLHTERFTWFLLLPCMYACKWTWTAGYRIDQVWWDEYQKIITKRRNIYAMSSHIILLTRQLEMIM